MRMRLKRLSPFVSEAFKDPDAFLKGLPRFIRRLATSQPLPAPPTAGLEQTEAVLQPGIVLPSRIVRKFPDPSRAIAAAIRYAQGALRWIHNFLSVQVLDARGLPFDELRQLLQGLPPAWQESVASGLEELEKRILQSDELAQVGV